MSAAEIQFDAIVTAPGFALGLCCDGEQLQAIRFLAPQPPLPPATKLAGEAVRQISAWLLSPQFVFDLPLSPRGTPFQQRVWAQISAIPPGETRNYGQLAQTLHSAPRPVGGACGANPFPLIIPCHRVVASDGGLGGFNRARGGFLLEIKRWLLAHEASAKAGYGIKRET